MNTTMCMSTLHKCYTLRDEDKLFYCHCFSWVDECKMSLPTVHAVCTTRVSTKLEIHAKP